MDIRLLSADEVRPLRASVLRPNLPIEESVYNLDYDPESLHLGAFADGRLVCVGSVLHEPPPGQERRDAWRLRGMATLEDVRRQGFGRAVLLRFLEEIALRGGTLFWCNARTDAVEFYRTLGFETVGREERTSRGTPYIRMQRSVTPRTSNTNQE